MSLFFLGATTVEGICILVFYGFAKMEMEVGGAGGGGLNWLDIALLK